MPNSKNTDRAPLAIMREYDALRYRSVKDKYEKTTKIDKNKEIENGKRN